MYLCPLILIPKRKLKRMMILAVISPTDIKSAGEGEGEGEGEEGDTDDDDDDDEEFARYSRECQRKTMMEREIPPPHVYNVDEDSGITKEDFDRYITQCQESQGFKVEDFPNAQFYSRITPINLSNKNYLEVIQKYAKIALEKTEGTKYTLDRVIRANVQIVRGALYYITFATKDANGLEVIFQTKVLHSHEGADVQLFRTASADES
ncbi:hypothetical protein LguiA_024408 [Lonicera macranthoides]